jgi:hypothetical protein
LITNTAKDSDLQVIIVGTDRDYVSFPVSSRLAGLAGPNIVALYDCFGFRLLLLSDVRKACNEALAALGPEYDNADVTQEEVAFAYSLSPNDNAGPFAFVSAKKKEQLIVSVSLKLRLLTFASLSNICHGCSHSSKAFSFCWKSFGLCGTSPT